MSIDIVPKSLYPLVPQAAGVPQLLRSVAQLADTTTLGYLGIGDALNSVIGYPPVEWAVFNSKGEIFATYDSFFAFDYSNTATISDYPIEKGSFTSYNKVDLPYDIRVTLHCGGSTERRAAFVQACENARASLDMYSILTPEKTYRNINFIGIDKGSTSGEGVNIAIVHLLGKEVRDNTSAQYSEPKSAAAFKSLDQGQLQPIDDVTIDTSGVV